MSKGEPAPESVEKFRALLKDGDMVGAFWHIKQLAPEDAGNLMLKAGFSISYDYKKNVKRFWERTQADIVTACRRQMDGYELRELPT